MALPLPGRGLGVPAPSSVCAEMVFVALLASGIRPAGIVFTDARWPGWGVLTAGETGGDGIGNGSAP